MTIKDSYPLPLVDDTLDTLAGARWFSFLDHKSGFLQVEVIPKDRETTAFTICQGLWQYWGCQWAFAIHRLHSST